MINNLFKVWTFNVLLLCTVLTNTSHASIIYDWSGDCTSGCTGTSTGVLTLADGFTGSTVSLNANFISWEYIWDSGSYTITSSSSPAFLTTVFFQGTIAHPTRIVIDYTGGGTFHNEILPTWNEENIVVGVSHVGNNIKWTLRSVPEPSTLAIMGLG